MPEGTLVDIKMNYMHFGDMISGGMIGR
jgi:hypothetical protein